MKTTGIRILAGVSLVIVLASCVTATENHGYTLGSGKRSFGIDSQFGLTQFDGSTFWSGQVRPDLRFGVSDNFDLGITASMFAQTPEGSAWARANSVGVYGLMSIPTDNGSIALGVGVDYWFNFAVGIDDSLFGSNSDQTINRWVALVPRGSAAYSFNAGNLKPYIGLFYNFAYVGIYGGTDIILGRLKPSIGLGVYRPAYNASSSGSVPIIFTVDPSLSWVF